MAMNKAVKSILKVLSEEELDVERDRRLAELKKLDPIRIFTEKLDVHVENDEYEIPIRVYFPTRNKMKEELVTNYSGKVLLFFHGGGWATESIETYERICALLAQSTGQLVLSVEYRKSPEYHFPTPLMDGYAVAKALYTGKLIPNILPEDITLIGDSAGGNMAAAISLMARDRGDFMPRQQILIYPALWNDYTENTPFESVRENGSDYLLTAPRIEAYLDLYQSKPEDRLSPYFAPLLEDALEGLPRTLILTAEYDPLRDEGEEYGRRLEAAGNEVEVYRIPDAFHGYFSLGLKHIHVLESLEKVNMFLGGGEQDETGNTETEKEA